MTADLSNSRVEITRGRRGYETVLVVGEDGERCYLHSLYDPIREASELAAGRQSATTLVFLGTGLGYHISPTLVQNPQTNRIVIVERYPELACRAAASITDPSIRVDMVTGDNPEIPPDLQWNNLAIIPHPPSLNANTGWYDRCRIRLATVGAERSSAPRTGSGNGPLTVLVPFEAYYAQSECIHGFESLGHRVLVMDCRGREGDEVSLFEETVRRERPDMVFSVNMRGLDRRGVVAEMLKRLGIPLALWFVDSPEFILYGEAIPPPDGCHVFLWDRSYIPMVASLGYRVSYLPLGADVRLCSSARVDGAYECGISFVGNSLVSGFLGRLAVKFPVTPEAMALAERGIERIIAGRGRQLAIVDELIGEGSRFLPDDDARLFFRAYLLHGATSLYRSRVLEQLIPLGLTTFGDPEGWRRLFGRDLDARPDVNYFRETPMVYASSAVNINATSLQMPAAVNQRVFDVPLCGGFLLTDRQGDLMELFAEDEVATYDGIGDVAEMARFYMERPETRKRMAEKARQRVLGEHTYGHRMGKVIATVIGGR